MSRDNPSVVEKRAVRDGSNEGGRVIQLGRGWVRCSIKCGLVGHFLSAGGDDLARRISHLVVSVHELFILFFCSYLLLDFRLNNDPLYAPSPQWTVHPL